ncbi:MAG: nucleotide exchange factor GrpE [Candidatus Riflebacteria bacterium]|nr:nucleotide exchange factor GrpE [Candidatus Riflebacteria bacterium]
MTNKNENIENTANDENTVNDDSLNIDEKGTLNEANSEMPKKVEAVLEEKKDLDKVQELNKELTEVKNKYYRALADYQNLQRRTAKEQLEARGRGAEDFVKKLLPVLDTLDKAMEQLAKVQVDKKIMDGLEMFSIQFTDVLEKEGLKAIAAQGCKFDPNFHEALSKQSNPEREDEIVIDVYEKGYTFKDRVLRSAKVVINQL